MISIQVNKALYHVLYLGEVRMHDSMEQKNFKNIRTDKIIIKVCWQSQKTFLFS